MIMNYCRVSKHIIMEKAKKSLQFQPFFTLLQSKYPYSIVEEKIVKKVRALSVSQRSIQQVDGEDFSETSNMNISRNPLAENSENLDLFSPVIPSTSIFHSNKDELLFRNGFAASSIRGHKEN